MDYMSGTAAAGAAVDAEAQPGGARAARLSSSGCGAGGVEAGRGAGNNIVPSPATAAQGAR